jgi:hypothetical protein
MGSASRMDVPAQKYFTQSAQRISFGNLQATNALPVFFYLLTYQSLKYFSIFVCKD